MDSETRRQVADFVAARSGRLMRFAYTLTCDQHAAEDLVQAALAKAMARWRSVRDNPEAYVRRTIYHEYVSRWRWRSRRPETVVAEPPETGTADRTGEVDLRMAMASALARLPARKRAVLVLRYLEDLPEVEVAEIMRCSVGTVRSQAAKAKEQLRRLLPEYLEVPS